MADFKTHSTTVRIIDQGSPIRRVNQNSDFTSIWKVFVFFSSLDINRESISKLKMTTAFPIKVKLFLQFPWMTSIIRSRY